MCRLRAPVRRVAEDVGQADPRLPEVQGEEGREAHQPDLFQAQGRRLVFGPLQLLEAEVGRRWGLFVLVFQLRQLQLELHDLELHDLERSE